MGQKINSLRGSSPLKVATELGISKTTMYRWMGLNLIPHTLLPNGRAMISEEAKENLRKALSGKS